MTAILAVFGALSPRTWVTIIIGAAIAAVLAGIIAWAHGKDVAIERAQREARAAHVQTAHAVLYGLHRQNQVFADVASIAALRRDVEAQNASLAHAETVSRQMASAQAQAARQTASALQARDRTIAALRARRLTPDDCDQGLELLRGN